MRDLCPSCSSPTALGMIVCFKCGYVNTFNTTPGYFGGHALNERKQVMQLRDDIILAPRNFTPKSLAFLYKCGIYDHIIIRQRLAYCPDINKLLIPAFKNNDLMFYQLRKLDDNDDAKYTTHGSTYNNTIIYDDHENKTLVLCEDHLSAMRIRGFYNVNALSGTSLKFSTILSLLDHYDNFIFWLDPDQPGREALYKNLSKLKWNSAKYNTKRMFLDKKIIDYKFSKVNYNKITRDPKLYLDNEIVQILENEVLPL